MALPPMGPMSPPSPTLGGPQPNMGPPPMPPMPQMGGGMAPPMAPPPMGPQMGPPPINPTNPTAGNGQSFGGDAGGRKTFSQYLQSMNKSFPPTPAAQDPMAGGIGGGAPSMPPLAMMGGGAVPRSTMIGREPHRLAYINPGEEMMLRASGGTGEPGPGAYLLSVVALVVMVDLAKDLVLAVAVVALEMAVVEIVTVLILVL